MTSRSVLTAVLLVILATTATPGAAAQEQGDSLRYLLAGSEGQERVDVLNEIAAELAHSDPEAAVRAGREALEESRSQRDIGGQLRASCTIGHAYYHIGDDESAIQSIERALRLPATSETRRERGLCYNELGNAHQEFGRDEEAVAAYLRAVTVLEAGRLSEDAARAHTNLGLLYWQHGHYSDALSHHQDALGHYEDAGAARHVAHALNNIGVIYYQWGEYELALKHYERSRDLRQELGDESGVALMLNNMGLIYQEWEQLDHARRMYLDAYERLDTTQASTVWAYTLHNLGSVHQAVGDFDGALGYFERSRDVYRVADPADGRIMSLVSIGQLRHEMGDQQAALAMLQDARQRAADIGASEHEARALKELGRVHQTMGALDEAVRYFQRSQALGLKMGKRSLVRDNVLLLSSTYQQLGDYRQALEHYQAYDRLQDSLFDERSQWLLADMKSRYEAARAENENAILRTAQQRQEFILLLVSLLLVVVLIAAAVLHRANRKIARQRNEQRELLHILSHDLANPLGNVRGCLKIMLEEPDTVDEFGRMALKVADSGIDIISMVREMQALEDGRLETEAVSLRAAVEDAALNLSGRLQEKGITLSNDVPAGTTVLAERRSLVNSVIANVLTNAIKFSHPGQRIEVQASEVDAGLVLFSVRDYGIGMPPDVLAHLFDLDKSTSRAGTAEERGNGYGLPLVKKFVDLYGGTIEVRSHQDQQDGASHEQGTEVRITLNRADDDVTSAAHMATACGDGGPVSYVVEDTR